MTTKNLHAYSLLRAIGVDINAPSNASPLPLNLPEITRVLENGTKPDAARDRNGSSALGVAAYLGRIEAMKVLMEYGADLESENLDGTAPLAMAVFGKQPAAVAMLLVYGGEMEYQDAWNDAKASGNPVVLSVFDAWDNDVEHPLLTKAEQLHAQSEPIMAARGSQAENGSVLAGGGGSWQSRAERAEKRAAEAEARVAQLEANLKAMEKRAVSAEEALIKARRGGGRGGAPAAAGEHGHQRAGIGGFVSNMMGRGSRVSSAHRESQQDGAHRRTGIFGRHKRGSRDDSAPTELFK